MSVVELKAEWSTAVVLAAATVTTLGASDASSGRVVVFAPALEEGIFDYVLVAPHACCLMAYASAHCRDLLI